MHPAPGNTSGTLVNGILHHCNLPNVEFSKEEALSDTEDSDDELNGFSSHLSSFEGLDSRNSMTSIRPGIVHRLDKGTSGLLVVAKVLLHFLITCQKCQITMKNEILLKLQNINIHLTPTICMP